MSTLVGLCSGCARGGAELDEDDRVSHPAGFGVVVPEGWTWTRNDDGLRLVGTMREGDGHPTMRIEAIPASELPEDFLEGKHLEWPGGRASYRYYRWSNALGHGDGLKVSIATEACSLVVVVEHWSEKIGIDRGFYRREVWPIIESIRVAP